jgi:preprotein translocase subunit YajC
MVVWLVLLFGLMYFMLIRPQKKQREAHQKLMDSLKKGDRVVTSGGLLGTIVGMSEGQVILDSFEGTKVRIQKAHITGLQTEPTAKTEEKK